MSKEWCYITITTGERVKIDKEDREKIEKHSWRVTKGTTGRRRVVCSVRTEKGVRSLTLGKFRISPPDGKQVYPRRFNEELDYRKENLIICTMQERQRLLPKNRIKSSSHYRGVSKNSSTGLYRAGIEVNGKSINLGDFKNEESAAAAYNKAALKHFGKDAYQNKLSGRKVVRKS